jgi:hypothetical protein
MKSAGQELFPAAHQLTFALDSVQLRGMHPVERDEAIARLASLLMEAAGVPAKESGDDRV